MVSNSLMLQHCANFCGRTQFAPTVITLHLQLFSWDVEDTVPYIVAENLHLPTPPFTQGNLFARSLWSLQTIDGVI